jgi:hypothetical protein
MIANRAAKVYTSFNNEIATYHPNNIVEVSQSRHVLVPQNTGTFDASYRAGKPFQNKGTIDASFDESTDTPTMIYSSEGFFDLIFRLKQRSLSLQKARQRSQSQV